MDRKLERKAMRDIIDERNEKERISRSIIKFWNVNYIPKPYCKTDTIEEKADDVDNEVNKDLQEEIEELDEFYNATTGSYSGTYGAKEISDDVTKGRISRILQEKSDALRNLIEESTEDFLGEEE